jgi:hypothetical protein
MANDDHLDSDQVPPHLIASLRDVSRASDDQRNQHIATAMTHLAVNSRSPRNSWLSVAAASLLLVAGGVSIGRFTSDSKSTKIAAASPNAPTTVVAKGSVDTSTTVPPLCVDRVNGEFIGSYTVSGTQWLMFASGTTLDVVNASTCLIASQSPLPTAP